MTKADLVEQVTASIARTAGPMISKKDCARVVDAFLEAVKDALKQQHNIEVRGFGTFKIRRRKTRMARNPRTGDPVEVAARPEPDRLDLRRDARAHLAFGSGVHQCIGHLLARLEMRVALRALVADEGTPAAEPVQGN